MVLMTKDKLSKKSHEPEEKKPGRKGSVITVWIEESVVQAMQEFIENSHPRVTQKATVQAALQDFLAEKGFWPRKD